MTLLVYMILVYPLLLWPALELRKDSSAVAFLLKLMIALIASMLLAQVLLST